MQDLSTTFTVRALQPRDVPLLQQLLSEWLPAEWESADASHRYRVLVQAQGDEPAGFAEYQQILDEGHLLGIAIVPGMQRRGLGLHLLQAVLADMRNAGCTRCLLEVRRSNVAAQALYQRTGFMLDGLRKDYYPAQGGGGEREDALLYSLML